MMTSRIKYVSTHIKYKIYMAKRFFFEERKQQKSEEKIRKVFRARRAMITPHGL